MGPWFESRRAHSPSPAWRLGNLHWDAGTGAASSEFHTTDRREEKGRATDFKGSALHQEAEKRDAVLDVLFSVAQELGATPGQVASVRVRAKGVLPVIEPRTRAQLDDTLASLSVRLSPEQLRRLDEVSAVPVSGPPGMARQRAL